MPTPWLAFKFCGTEWDLQHADRHTPTHSRHRITYIPHIRRLITCVDSKDIHRRPPTWNYGEYEPPKLWRRGIILGLSALFTVAKDNLSAFFLRKSNINSTHSDNFKTQIDARDNNYCWPHFHKHDIVMTREMDQYTLAKRRRWA